MFLIRSRQAERENHMRTAIPILATALVAAAPAHAQKRSDYFVSGNWRGHAYFPEKGRFSNCSMHARFKSGISLYFGLTVRGRFRIGFWKPDWVLKRNSRHRVTLYIDRRPVFRGVARVVAERDRSMVLVDLPLSRALLDRFRGGYVLRVDAPRGRMGFSLAGSDAALRKLVGCVASHLEKKPVGDNPFAAPGARTPRAGDPPGDTALRVRAVTLIANVLGRVAVGRYEIMPLDKVPERWRTFHALWRAGKTIGLVRLYRKVSPSDRRGIFAAIVDSDFDDCSGGFQSGVKRSGAPGQPITFFSRFTGEEEWALYYVVVGPDKAGTTYLVGLYSPDRNEPLDLGDRVRRALTALVMKTPEKEKPTPETFQQ
jgi:hypothetical protein